MTQLKRTKIVATIGPATESKDMVKKIIDAGVDVIRLNFSHGDHTYHRSLIETVRGACEEMKREIALIQDLAGPKIRIGDFEEGEVQLVSGKEFILTTESCEGTEERVFVSYEHLPQEVAKGGIILLDDGKVRLEVTRVEGKSIYTQVLTGGKIRSRRGVNVPGAYLNISSLTPKDREDIVFGFENDVDFVALSFVRKAQDVYELKSILKEMGSRAHVISKIETQEAVDNLDDIIAASDAVMVARGDLAIEIPAEDVPLIQKRIITTCKNLGKPVITATQMLESMIHNASPFRSEVSDIANAVFDGSDAVMLSGETAVGAYPYEAVEVMSRVARRIEKDLPVTFFRRDDFQVNFSNVAQSVALGVVRTANDIKAPLIVAMSDSEDTARMVARYRPTQPILAITSDLAVCRRLSLSFGCYPVFINAYINLSETTGVIRNYILENSLALHEDSIVIAAGSPLGRTNEKTCMMLVETI
jgi:pyruvate kinase